MKIAMLFPGYSSQFVGMGKDLYDDHRIIQEYFEEASNCLNMNFVKLCFASSDVELSKLHNAYPALFLVNAAIAKLLQTMGINPDVVIGYADGEYAALATAGAISLPDSFYLLSKQSIFYEDIFKEKHISALRVTGLSASHIEKMCQHLPVEQSAFIAISHSQTEHIVVGYQQSIDTIKEIILNNRQGSFDFQSNGIGTHSSLMNSVVNQLKMYFEKVDFRDLKIPLLSQLNGSLITQGVQVKKELLNIINTPLTFIPLLETVKEYDIIIEIGSKTPLHRIIKKYYPQKNILEIKKNADIDTLKNVLKYT